MKFQVGDIVRRTVVSNGGFGPDGKEWRLHVGTECLVWEIEKRSNWLRVVTEGVPMNQTHDCDYFELVHRKVADPVPDVRNTDPDTSKVAAKAIKPKKLSIKASILDLLDKYPDGLTGHEIADFTGHRLNSITPRFAELSRGAYEYSGGVKVALAGAIINSRGVRNGQIVWVLA